MDRVPSIVMICWNRLEYLERTVTHLLADPSDFRLYFWDNGSTDGATDFIADLRDDRIEARQFSKENVRQAPPWFWFLDNAKGDIVGKLDDDILGPQGWMTRFADMIADEPKLGLLGAWVYQPEEWDEALAAHKIRDVGQWKIFQNAWVGGCIMLGRKEVFNRFSPRDSKLWGTPIDHIEVTRAGYVSGYPLPMAFAENLDDPRHPLCRMNRPGGWDEFAAYTARMRDFAGPEEYGQWIAEDARKVLTETMEWQTRWIRPTLKDRIKGPIKKLLGRA
jgi:glycosyltransferase involved in cell wall biosynthesis